MKYKFKIVVIGDSSVGKTSIINMFTQNKFYPCIETTIGCDMVCHVIQINNREIILEIWDTAGQEIFLSMTKSFYKNACGAIVTYDSTNLQSFNKIYKWIDELDSVTHAEILLAGTKTDMVDNIQVSSDIVAEYAKNNNLMFVETSAKNNLNINKCFYDLAMKILDNIDNGQMRDHPGIKIIEETTIDNIIIDIQKNDDNIDIKKSKCC